VYAGADIPFPWMSEAMDLIVLRRALRRANLLDFQPDRRLVLHAERELRLLLHIKRDFAGD